MNAALPETPDPPLAEPTRSRELNPVMAVQEERLRRLSRDLLSTRGEASGVSLACEIMNLYERLESDGRERFFDLLRLEFGPDRRALRELAARYARDGDEHNELALAAACEPKRQELIRRLNLAHGNIGKLVAMRADLLEISDRRPDLRIVDEDFRHLFSSWFNRGFLTMRRIDWSTSAAILERIIRYERVHAFADWNDLRRRLAPVDRRCYAFFHPALSDEPLIFVAVALTRDVPDAIAPLLAEDRPLVPPGHQTTAVFYSINNTQRGLQGVSFGNFLIKQVAQELRRDITSLTTFVTLSPVPGFAAWLERERATGKSEALRAVERHVLELLDEPAWHLDPVKARRIEQALLPAAAFYFLRAKNRWGRPVDPVARFHLGNGARLERLNWLADRSALGRRRSYGLMVNYLYALDDVEPQHEAYANTGAVAASSSVLELLRSGMPSPVARNDGPEHDDD
jgi:malonyl-CoA decarboxylase